jgi:hypothetical protein
MQGRGKSAVSRLTACMTMARKLTASASRSPNQTTRLQMTRAAHERRLL